ncbi:MAG TPA: ribosome-associated ATPase/putative transporter RbbA [Acetobacteraceae bacterium]|nr:ribosome-associated ATPase/putative transporter RbbA [Acetobacteraceae bacterium]
MQSSALVARLSAIGLRYGSTVALDDVNLDIPAGCIVGFIGPDGVGKSSLLALLSSARKIQSGSVEVLGGNMADVRHRNAVCPRIAYMPQGLGKNLYPTLSVAENLEFFARLFGQSRAERAWRMQELLHSTGLAPFAERSVEKLSGGMKQKLGLCCALIHDPDLMILDEPTTGVDPLSRRQFWELIARIRSRRPGMSVLVATAYMDEAERFDWLIAMDAGKVLAAGTPQSIQSRMHAGNLEEAFVALLPADKRAGHQRLAIPPRRSQDDTPAIEARDLTRQFGDFVAVDHVSFQIGRGEIFGFVGSNGCGKTTTMKMLTGLLPPSAGQALLFGAPMDADGLATRSKVGFMSQSFSLYTELTVRQNLVLHARLFHLPRAQVAARVTQMTERFGLVQYMDQLTEKLPLGVRQRLALAVAVIHEPEMLILDEPTSGVDPVARDRFWELLIDLSRNRGVTIFVSTHFMYEAQRCDRVALMHAGKVLAQGTPAAITQERGAANLEEAFIAYLEDAESGEQGAAHGTPAATAFQAPVRAAQDPAPVRFSSGRLWAYVRRETLEVLRDPIRLAFALLGPIMLMIVFGYGISFDVENLSYAALDRDRSPESRTYLENFSSSRYFREQPALQDHMDMEQGLRSGRLKFAIEIPPDFGKDLKRGRHPEVSAVLDGANPFRAETSRGYLEGVHQAYLARIARDDGQPPPALPVNVEIRFRYNQDFKSVFAMVPGVIMMVLILIPAMMTALGVVREKELGSITNLYVTPVTRLEFLLGKQLPYVVLSLVNFACLLLLTVFLFEVPVKGSLPALVGGAMLYVIAATEFGLLISTFVKSQIAAIFASAILSTLPAIQFSGLLLPVSSLSRDAKIMGAAFPSTYFHHISVGVITKGLRLHDLIPDYAALIAVIGAYLLIALALLRKQER